MYQEILDLSEVWVVLIGITVFLVKRNRSKYLVIVATYLFIALFLNTFANVIQRISSPRLPELLRYNNWLYNIHSFVITIHFILFFHYTAIKSKWRNTKWVIILFVLWTIIVFTFFDSFFRVSSKLFAVEGIILLLYSVSFFLQKLKDEDVNDEFDAALVITTGLTIYEAINFFIFLFYPVLMNNEKKFVISLWDIHDYSYIAFCLFISYAFYGRSKAQKSSVIRFPKAILRPNEI